MTQQRPRRPSPFGEGSDGLGYPSAAPRAGTPPFGSAGASGPPGVATTASVLGFVTAAAHGLLAAWLLVSVVSLAGAAGPQPSSTDLAITLGLVVGWTTLSAMVAVGSLRLLQRADRTLLVRGSVGEIVGIVLVVAAAWVLLDDRTAGALAPLALAGISVTAVRWVLLQQPAVTAWLVDPVERADEAPLRALLVPHALLLTATLLVFGFAAS